MSNIPAQRGVAAAYACDGVPLSDRLFNLLEAPLGATALLSGLIRQREGGSLCLVVRPPSQDI